MEGGSGGDWGKYDKMDREESGRGMDLERRKERDGGRGCSCFPASQGLHRSTEQDIVEWMLCVNRHQINGGIQAISTRQKRLNSF